MSTFSVSSAEAVANIEDLLTQILLSLPARSVVRFKCVSKHWLSLISNPKFFRRHTLQNSKISAFFSSKTEEESFTYIPLGNHEIPSGFNPFKSLNKSVQDGSKLKIIQSCNGLFLCVHQSGRQQYWFLRETHDPVYVVNPTTNKFVALSAPIVEEIDDPFVFVRYGLAFDPWKSTHYKVVCVSNTRFMKNHRVQVYSSETGTWGQRLKVPFFPSPSDEGKHHDLVKKPMHFDYRSREGAVYCNGAIHWIRHKWEGNLRCCLFDGGRIEFERGECDVLHYYDIGAERFRLTAARPPIPLVVKHILLKDSGYSRRETPNLVDRYFGESGGHLYLIELYKHCKTEFEVMEMEVDYSGWFVKYHVDLNPLFLAHPGQDSNAFVVLLLSGEEEDSSTHVLLHMPGKVISYNLRNKTFETSVELASKETFLALESLDDTYSYDQDENINYPYMEILACV